MVEACGRGNPSAKRRTFPSAVAAVTVTFSAAAAAPTGTSHCPVNVIAVWLPAASGLVPRESKTRHGGTVKKDLGPGTSTRPILLPEDSVNQTAPSGPTVIPNGSLEEGPTSPVGTSNSVTNWPVTDISPIRLAAISVN